MTPTDPARAHRAAALRAFAVGCGAANFAWTAWFVTLRTLPAWCPPFWILNTVLAVGLVAANILLA